MLFVTVNDDREQLNELTKMLLRIFRGSVIYQHTDPVCALRDVQTHAVDAVIVAEHTDEFAALRLLCSSGPQQPAVLVLSENEEYRTAALQQGADGAVCYPITEQALEAALQAVL